jgi:hypothetical protein
MRFVLSLTTLGLTPASVRRIAAKVSMISAAASAMYALTLLVIVLCLLIKLLIRAGLILKPCYLYLVLLFDS